MLLTFKAFCKVFMLDHTYIPSDILFITHGIDRILLVIIFLTSFFLIEKKHFKNLGQTYLLDFI